MCLNIYRSIKNIDTHAKYIRLIDLQYQLLLSDLVILAPRDRCMLGSIKFYTQYLGTYNALGLNQAKPTKPID